VLKTHGEEVQH